MGPNTSGPFESPRTNAKSARRSIRRHWSEQERLRRREMAELMQQRLLASLGGRMIAS